LDFDNAGNWFLDFDYAGNWFLDFKTAGNYFGASRMDRSRKENKKGSQARKTDPPCLLLSPTAIILLYED
jgi:hypothetical protein